MCVFSYLRYIPCLSICEQKDGNVPLSPLSFSFISLHRSLVRQVCNFITHYRRNVSPLHEYLPRHGRRLYFTLKRTLHCIVLQQHQIALQRGVVMHCFDSVWVFSAYHSWITVVGEVGGGQVLWSVECVHWWLQLQRCRTRLIHCEDQYMDGMEDILHSGDPEKVSWTSW